MYKNRLIVNVFILFTALLCVACNSNPHKIVKAKNLDANLVEHAEHIYYELFKACEQDNINNFVLHKYISPKMHKQLLKGKYKKLCTQVNDNIGEITSIEICEAVYLKNVLVAFRYKMNATKINTPIEFRLVLTIDNLLSGVGFYAWNDIYNHKTHQLAWFKP